MDNKNKMLIDATHPEETRVVAVRNGRVEEFDFESAARKLLRGNIYLAKVTRVEPSLQAAFIDYGGNRHGFLAFNEIHPDYYQIPIADRELLKQEEAEAEQRAEAEMEERVRSRGPRRRRRSRGERSSGSAEGRSSRGAAQDERDQPSEIETFEDGYRTSGPSSDDDVAAAPVAAQPYRHATVEDDVLREDAAPLFADPLSSEASPLPGSPTPAPDNDPVAAADTDAQPAIASPDGEAVPPGPTPPPAAYPRGEAPPTALAAEAAHDVEPDVIDVASVDDVDDDDDDTDTNGAPDDETVEQVTTEDDALEELPERPRRRARQYKIQEVIKRRQIMLVQVVKEERGNKGAALTTYISLAGRYTVLMPNTARGGGISRKITQPQDRKRLKAIAEELDVPEGMGLIIRTAGAARTKQEIKRDYEYLLRLWESVRDLTLSSTAPCLVYEEGNIIKRAIRDLYSKDFDQIVVAGDSAHREAQDFMEMLMPGSGSHVASYRAPEPLFARYGVERQLNALFSPYVTLRSGGYIVINQTEALVSVDVNSGKSTREFSIEETALNTNLEAAEEIARQLKLRDLAGLIVVDFIDMEEKRNNRAVERRLKDALRHDRARIQVGRISHFGLLEMSRQRLRSGILEGSTSQCPHCQGTGIIRSIESVALAVLRGIEDQLLKQPSSLVAAATAEVALYILNHKRAYITDMERRHGVIIRVEASDRMQGANFAIERTATPATAKPAPRAAVSMEWGFDRDDEAADETDDLAAEPLGDEPRDGEEGTHVRGDGGTEEERRGRRRRRRRGRRDRDGEPREGTEPGHPGSVAPPSASASSDDERPDATSPGPDDALALEDDGAGDEGPDAAAGEHADEAGGEPRRRGRRRGRRGGRSRRREGEAPNAAVASLDDVDRHEWGIAEYARPGAEQPSEFTEGTSVAHALHLVRSVEVEARRGQRQETTRATIVESIGGAAGDSDYAYSTAEAIRLAVNLAGGVPDAPKEEVALPVAASDAPVVEIDEKSASAPSGEPPAVAEPTTAETSEIVAAAPQTPSPEALEPVSAETSTVEPAEQAASSPSMTPTVEDAHGEAPPPPRSNGHDTEHPVEPVAAHVEPEPQHEPFAIAAAEEPPRPARKGWWQRRFGSE